MSGEKKITQKRRFLPLILFFWQTKIRSVSRHRVTGGTTRERKISLSIHHGSSGGKKSVSAAYDFSVGTGAYNSQRITVSFIARNVSVSFLVV